MVRLINRAEQAGNLRREPSSVEHRAVRMVLTARGEKMQRRLRRFIVSRPVLNIFGAGRQKNARNWRI